MNNLRPLLALSFFLAACGEKDTEDTSVEEDTLAEETDTSVEESDTSVSE